MKAPRVFSSPVRALGGSAALLLCLSGSLAEEIEAVSSRVSDDYVRSRLPDGRYQSETYAFAKGGFWSGNRSDRTIDRMDFMDVARTIAAPLAGQSYVAAKEPGKTRLLIVVYWGTTMAPEHASDSSAYHNLNAANDTLNQIWPVSQQHDPYGNTKLPSGAEAWSAFDQVTTSIAAVQAENRLRDNVDRQNAMMLGYDTWWNTTFNAQNGTPLEVRKHDLMNELEQDRYFVVLMAYDFQMLWKQKKSKLLWETRFSVSEHHNSFDKDLPAMTLYASRYFGQDSHGLRHDPIREGDVLVGDVKSLGAVPEK